MTDDRDRWAARDYLDRFTEEPTWDVYSPDAEKALEAIFESVAAEARGQVLRDVAAAFNGDEAWTEIEIRDWLRAAAGDQPSTHRWVAREDLAHALGMCGCHPVKRWSMDPGHENPEAVYWPAAHTEAIDRLRAGEE